MKLKNSALQELYDTVVASTITISPYEASPIDKAFKKCDDKLSESITFAHIKDLEDRNDILEGSNKALLEANLELASKKRKIEKEIEELKKQNENLASQYQKLTIENKRLQDTKTTLVKANTDRTNLQEACDKLSGENRRLKFETDLLSKEIDRYRIRYKEQSDKILGLKSRLNSMCGDEYLNKLLDSTRNDGYEQGQKDLWDKLQEVSDYYYFGGDDEFDTDDCEMTSMTDIIDNLNVDQFLEAYKNWHKAREQERIKHMRDYLERFCRGRLCSRCPLWSDEYKCSCLYSFNGAHPIPDEDIKRYYEKVRACSKPVCHFERECTLEGTVEINKDLLNKIYGIDSDD